MAVVSGSGDVTDGANDVVNITVSIEGDNGNVLVLKPNDLLLPGNRYRVVDQSSPFVSGEHGDGVSPFELFYHPVGWNGVKIRMHRWWWTGVCRTVIAAFHRMGI